MSKYCVINETMSEYIMEDNLTNAYKTQYEIFSPFNKFHICEVENIYLSAIIHLPNEPKVSKFGFILPNNIPPSSFDSLLVH
jgi:hypothetical protein